MRCLATDLHTIDPGALEAMSADGSTTVHPLRTSTEQAGPLPPQALGNARKEQPLRGKRKLQNNGQTSQSALRTDEAKLW